MKELETILMITMLSLGCILYLFILYKTVRDFRDSRNHKLNAQLLFSDNFIEDLNKIIEAQYTKIGAVKMEVMDIDNKVASNAQFLMEIIHKNNLKLMVDKPTE